MNKRSAGGVALTPAMERSIERLIRAGRYRSRSEAMRDALRLLLDRELQRQAAIRSIRERVAKGIAQAERGEWIDGDAFMRDWATREQRLLTRRRKSA